jgi:hypothetical protein
LTGHEAAIAEGKPRSVDLYLKQQGKRIKLATSTLDLLDFGLTDYADAVPPGFAPTMDVMQVVVAGADFANKLERNGLTLSTTLSAAALTSKVIDGIGTYIPQLSDALPHIKLISLGLKVASDLQDYREERLRLDVHLD